MEVPKYIGNYKLQAKLRNRINADPYLKVKLRKVTRCQYVFGGRNVDLVIDKIQTRDGIKIIPKTIGSLCCHNSWICPICSAKVAAEHQHRMDAIIDRELTLYNQKPVMFTVKVPHHKDMTAKEVLDLLTYQINGLKKWRVWQECKTSFNSHGTMSSIECTYSKNGYHFHTHIFMFIDMEKVNDELLFKYTERMGNLLNKSLTKYYEGKQFLQAEKYPIQLSVDENNKPNYFTSGAYLTASSELTQGNSKHCRAETSRQMFELLASGKDEDWQIFREYALAVFNKRKYNYTPNLSKNIDEWMANRQIYQCIDTVTVATFTGEDWNNIVDFAMDTEQPILTEILLATLEGYDKVYELTESYGLPPPIKPTKQYRPYEIRQLQATA